MQLPTLLAPGNLPALHAVAPTSYRIHTSETDKPRFEEHPGIAALRQILPVEIATSPDDAFKHPVETHLGIWRDGVSRARAVGAHFMALPADMLWADGAFGHLAQRLAAGEVAVYALFMRVVHETITEALGWRSGGPPLPFGALPPRELVGLALRHIHPLLAAYRRDSEHFPFHPEYIIWPVPGEGVLMRSLATTALIFDPQHCAVDHHFSLLEGADLERVGFIDDSDQLFGVSLTPLTKDVNWFFTRQTADIETIGAWWNVFDGYAHDHLADHAIRFHAAAPTETAWRRAELRSNFLVGQSRTARELIRIGRFLRSMGYSAASEYLAMAIMLGRLRRMWRWQGPFTIFCPSEAALTALAKRTGEVAVSPERVLAHVVEGIVGPAPEERWAKAMGSLWSLAGKQVDITSSNDWEVQVNGHPILESHRLPGDRYRVHIIDGILDD